MLKKSAKARFNEVVFNDFEGKRSERFLKCPRALGKALERVLRSARAIAKALERV